MRNFVKTIPIIFIIAIAITFTACGASNQLKGKWMDKYDTIEFKSNGKYSSSYYFGASGESTYTITGNTVTLAVPLLGNEKYTYEIKDNILYLKKGNNIEYQFKKKD